VHPEDGQTAKLSRNDTGVPFRIYGEQEFTDALFPWFEPSTAPSNAAGLKSLIERPGVAERLAQIGVRYVVWLDGSTRKTDGGGSVACTGRAGLPPASAAGAVDYVASVGYGRLASSNVTTTTDSVLIARSLRSDHHAAARRHRTSEQLHRPTGPTLHSGTAAGGGTAGRVELRTSARIKC
jgi:hypothetical protein